MPETSTETESDAMTRWQGDIPKGYFPAAESAHDLFNLNLPTFEGPLDLLLFLIRRHALDILDIPMGFICDEYLKYLAQMQNLDIDVAAEFLYMAADLLHIKSKVLLPKSDTGDEDEEEDDPREQLVRRLLLYQRFKWVAQELEAMPRLGCHVFEREPETIKLPQRLRRLQKQRVEKLTAAFDAVLERQTPEVRHQVVQELISVREKIIQLLTPLLHKESVLFEELLKPEPKRAEMIVAFLAVLEMVRLQLAAVYQTQARGQLYVHPKFQSIGEARERLEPHEDVESMENRNEI